MNNRGVSWLKRAFEAFNRGLSNDLYFKEATRSRSKHALRSWISLKCNIILSAVAVYFSRVFPLPSASRPSSFLLFVLSSGIYSPQQRNHPLFVRRKWLRGQCQKGNFSLCQPRVIYNGTGVDLFSHYDVCCPCPSSPHLFSTLSLCGIIIDYCWHFERVQKPPVDGHTRPIVWLPYHLSVINRVGIRAEGR